MLSFIVNYCSERKSVCAACRSSVFSVKAAKHLCAAVQPQMQFSIISIQTVLLVDDCKSALYSVCETSTGITSHHGYMDSEFTEKNRQMRVGYGTYWTAYEDLIRKNCITDLSSFILGLPHT